MKLKIITILVLVLLPVSHCLNGFRYGCPTDSIVIKNLSPCYCSQTFDQTDLKVTVTCNGLSDSKLLKTSMSGLKGYRIDELLIINSNLEYLPNDPFVNNSEVLAEIQTVSILNSRIGNIAEHSTPGTEQRSFFTGLGSSLTVLRVQSCGSLERWEWTRIKTSLSIGITPSGSLALKKLLFYNNIMSILPKSFDELGDGSTGSNPIAIKIERVILQWNSIRQIDCTLNFPEMEILDLSWNEIDSTGSLFSDQIPPKLGTLILKDNKIKMYSKDPFWTNLVSDKKSLTYIDLKDNPIDCHCRNMEWVKQINYVFMDGKCVTPSPVAGKAITTCYPDLLFKYK